MFRSKVLKNFDKDVVDRLVKHMTGTGVEFLKGSPLKFSRKDEQSKIEVTFTNGEQKEETREFDNVLLAVGRVPETLKILPSKEFLKLDNRSKIIVNDQY